MVGTAFAVLAASLLVVSTRDILTGRRPDESFWGIVYLAVTALVMFGLAFAKRRIATRIDSTPLEAEASMTFLDGILSTATMLGLLLNATLGWWWADPAAAFLVGLAAERHRAEAQLRNLHASRTEGHILHRRFHPIPSRPDQAASNL